MPEIPSLTTYGSVDLTKRDKDLLVIVKNSGTYAAPVYGSGSTRKITVEDFMAGMAPVRVIKKSLTAAQIKTLFSVPIVGVSFPGTGLASGDYAFDILSVSARNNFNSAAFDGSLGNLKINVGGADPIFQTGDDFIKSGVSKIVKCQEAGLTLPEINAGGNIMITASEDSTVGNGTIDVYITYRIITL